MSSISSRALEDSVSDSSEPECAQSDSAKSIPIAGQSSPSIGLASSSTTTLDLFPGSKESMLSPEEFLASQLASLANGLDNSTSGGYGQRSLKLFKHIAPAGSWQRTLSESLASSLTDLSGFAGHFETSVMIRGQSLSPLTTWAPHISDVESGLLLTPSATSYGTSNNGCPGDGRKEFATKGKLSLFTMARKNLWPTPTAMDSEQAGGKGCIERGLRGCRYTQAVRWPSPATRDFRFPNTKSYAKRGGGSKGEQLPNAVGGPLNPTWVEWLMGYPLGWTALKALVTPSSRKSPKSSAEPSCK